MPYLPYALFLAIAATAFAPMAKAEKTEGECAALIGTCDYYVCKSEELGCADSGYLFAFGYRYCNRFADSAPRFSQEFGQPWLTEVRQCLQRELEKAENLTCENAREIGLSSHITCYLATDYCSLPVSDKSKVFRIAWRAFFHRDQRYTWREIRRQCKLPDTDSGF